MEIYFNKQSKPFIKTKDGLFNLNTLEKEEQADNLNKIHLTKTVQSINVCPNKNFIENFTKDNPNSSVVNTEAISYYVFDYCHINVHYYNESNQILILGKYPIFILKLIYRFYTNETR